MYKFNFLIFSLSTLLMAHNSYIDLGVYGNTHEIKEKSFDILIKERYKKNFVREKVLSELKKKYEESFIIHSKLNECEKTLTREFIPEITLSQDIKIPNTNELLYKKGYTYNVLKENNIFFKKYLIFIDSNDDIQFNLAMQYKEYADIYVVKGDISRFLDVGVDAKITRDNIEINMLHVKCVPSIYTQQNNKFIINEYKTKDLIKDEVE